MFVVYSLLSSHFLTVPNITNVLVQCAPLLILAAGQTFPILMGGLDLSQGSIVSLVSVVTAGVMIDHGLGLGAFAGIGSGLLVGLVNGLLIGRSRIQPFIVTLGMLYMISGAAMVYSGGSSVFGLPQPDVDRFFWFGGGFIGPLPVPLLMRHPHRGRLCRLAARRSEEPSMRLAAMSRSRSCPASNGPNQALHLPDERRICVDRGVPAQRSRHFRSAYSRCRRSFALQSIGAVIIGGTSIFGGQGGILRTVLGVFVIAFMVNGLNLLAISTFVQEIIVGAIIIVSVWINSLQRTRPWMFRAAKFERGKGITVRINNGHR